MTTVLLDKNEINIFKNNKCIIKGKRNKADGLWDIPLQSIPNIISEPCPNFQHTANAIIRKSQAKIELAEYLYGCCGSPAFMQFKMEISYLGQELNQFRSPSISHQVLIQQKGTLIKNAKIYSLPKYYKTPQK